MKFKKIFIFFCISLVVSGIFVVYRVKSNSNISNKSDKNSLLLASFNVLRLGEKEKDYKILSKIINKFDIVGLEEVMNEKGMKKLRANLEKYSNEKWDYIISEKSVGSENYREYYAYIYKKDLVDEVKKLGFYKEKNENEFMREPYGAYFKVGNFDFIFVIAHSVFGDDEKYRILEGLKYVDVYEYFFKNFGEDDIIIGGDFNLPANDLAFSNLKIKYNVEYLLEPERNLTTFSKDKLVSSYDNFFINKSYTNEYTGKSGVYNFLNENNAYMKEYVSDHLLIYSEYNIK